MNRKKHVIVVAGGKGLRMGGEIPKQFLPIGGKPVLMRTIEAFYTYDSSIHVILVLPVSQQSYWKELCSLYERHRSEYGLSPFRSAHAKRD